MLTPEKIAELKLAHGENLTKVETPLGTLVFKKPSRAAYDKWSDDINTPGKSRSSAYRELAQHCLAHPTFAEFIAILDDMPGLLSGEVADACTKGTGLVEQYEVGKL